MTMMRPDDGGGRWSVFDHLTFERNDAAGCTCIHTCAEDPPTACSLSGDWHVHPGEPCPVHPDAPGDR
jgi:hypothetical protein